MRKTRLFLGSSSSAKAQAKALLEHLQSPSIEFLPWWEAFTPGRTLLEELDSIRNRVDGAVLLFSPEAESTVRKKPVQVPNLNVLFEFGYFYGHFKKERVAIIKYGDYYLPSDFGGYIHIQGSDSFRRAKALKVTDRTASEFGRWFNAGGFAEPSKAPKQSNPLAPINYPNMGIV